MSPGSDDALIALVREAAQDPERRARIQQALSGDGGQGLGATLSAIGKTLPASNVGAAGAALGAGLGLLLRRRQRARPGLGATTNRIAVTQAPEEELNHLETPAGFAPPAPPTPTVPLPEVTTGTANRLQMGVDSRGNNIHSIDGGKTWIDEAGVAATGPVYNQTDIGGAMRKGGRARGFGGKEMAAAIEPPAPAKKGVLTRRPVPVISTTIVIAPKKAKPKAAAKPEKKRRGGKIHPRKPNAVPPDHGPGNGDTGPPAPYRKGGRVQAARGSGAAIRGRSFSGIY